MTPAVGPREAVRMLVVAAGKGAQECPLTALPELLGDALIVINDAATLPASLPAIVRGEPVELRLASTRPWRAVLFGVGDWRTPTELRPGPPRVVVGDVFSIGEMRATILAIEAPRLLTLAFDLTGDALVHALYQHGRPIQYSYLRDALPLWAIQTPFAGRPWAVETPSAGRALPWSVTSRLRVATLTHGAGLSSTGDTALDARFPLPERYDIPQRTVTAVHAARAEGREIVAVGTSVVRALEGNVAAHGQLRHGEGLTDLRIGPSFQPRVVTSLLTGLHEEGTSHYDLLRGLFGQPLLDLGAAHLAGHGEHPWLGHEFGDVALYRAARQLDHETAPTGNTRFITDRSGVVRGDLSRQGESKSNTSATPLPMPADPEPRLENPLPLCIRNAGPVVFHNYAGATRCRGDGNDHVLPVSARVFDEIPQHAS